MTTLKCNSCGRELDFTDSQAGTQFDCPHCGARQIISQTPQGLEARSVPEIPPEEDEEESAYLFGPAIPEPRAYRFFGYLVLYLGITIALFAIIAGVGLILTPGSSSLENALGLNLIFIGVCVVFVGIFVLLVCKWIAAIQTHSQKILEQVQKISRLMERQVRNAEKRR